MIYVASPQLNKIDRQVGNLEEHHLCPPENILFSLFGEPHASGDIMYHGDIIGT